MFSDFQGLELKRLYLIWLILGPLQGLGLNHIIISKGFVDEKRYVYRHTP